MNQNEMLLLKLGEVVRQNFGTDSTSWYFY